MGFTYPLRQWNRTISQAIAVRRAVAQHATAKIRVTRGALFMADSRRMRAMHIGNRDLQAL